MKRIAIALVVTAFIAACSGGGGGSHGTVPAAQSTAPVIGSGMSPSTNTGTAPVSVTVRIPGRGTNALGRQPRYISTNTATIQAVTGLGTTTTPCSGASCTITFQAPIASNTSITINLLDASNNLLSTVTGSFNVQAGYANAFNVTFVGVVSSIVLSATPSSVVSLVGPTPITVTMTTYDASGAEILGTNGYSDSLGEPLTLTINVIAYTPIPASKVIGHGAQSNARASSLARLRPLGSAPSSTAGFTINPIAGYITEGLVAPTFTVTYNGTTRLQNSGGYNIQAYAKLTSSGNPDPDTLTNNPVLVSATLEGLTLSDALGTLNTLTTLSPPNPLNPLQPSFYPDPSANSPTISTLEILAPPTQAPLAISLYLTEANPAASSRTINTVNPVSQPTCPPSLFSSAPVVVPSTPPTWNFSIIQVASQSRCWIGVSDGTNEADLSIAVNGVSLTIQGAKRQQGAQGR
jgi:hypothetical protein